MPAPQSMIKARAKVPEHVVYRAFVQETVVLNMQTGKYHGLNPTGGRMLEIVDRVSSLEHAAKTLAEEYDRPVDEISADLCQFCADLERRGLLELDDAE